MGEISRNLNVDHRSVRLIQIFVVSSLSVLDTQMFLVCSQPGVPAAIQFSQLKLGSTFSFLCFRGPPALHQAEKSRFLRLPARPGGCSPPLYWPAANCFVLHGSLFAVRRLVRLLHEFSCWAPYSRHPRYRANSILRSLRLSEWLIVLIFLSGFVILFRTIDTEHFGLF